MEQGRGSAGGVQMKLRGSFSKGIFSNRPALGDTLIANCVSVVQRELRLPFFIESNDQSGKYSACLKRKRPEKKEARKERGRRAA